VIFKVKSGDYEYSVIYKKNAPALDVSALALIVSPPNASCKMAKTIEVIDNSGKGATQYVDTEEALKLAFANYSIPGD
jgi:hypothetical protein